MSEHECIIGMYYDYENTELVTVNELLEKIESEHRLYDYVRSLGIKRKPPYTLEDYCDRRKSTNLTRFEFCPYCGKKIGWKEIKKEGAE